VPLEIDFSNLLQLFVFAFATSFGAVLATRLATKLLEFIEIKIKLAVKVLNGKVNSNA
jgi:hypothetical protein